MYAVLKVDSSWLADPLNNTHRKVYLGPPLSSLSPFLSYVLLLCLIDSRSGSSSVASLNTVRISKKKHWKFKHFELPRMPQSTPFSRQPFQLHHFVSIENCCASESSVAQEDYVQKTKLVYISFMKRWRSWSMKNDESTEILAKFQDWNLSQHPFKRVHIFWWPHEKKYGGLP